MATVSSSRSLAAAEGTEEKPGASPVHGSRRPVAAKEVGKYDRTSAEKVWEQVK
jgi:hypothetical protein